MGLLAGTDGGGRVGPPGTCVPLAGMGTRRAAGRLARGLGALGGWRFGPAPRFPRLTVVGGFHVLILLCLCCRGHCRCFGCQNRLVRNQGFFVCNLGLLGGSHCFLCLFSYLGLFRPLFLLHFGALGRWFQRRISSIFSCLRLLLGATGLRAGAAAPGAGGAATSRRRGARRAASRRTRRTCRAVERHRMLTWCSRAEAIQ